MSEWPKTSLGKVAQITMGQSPDSSTVSAGEYGMPFLQGCAEFGERVPSPKLRCAPPLRVAKKNSVLISVRAPVGTTNFADQDYCIGRGLGSILEKPGESDARFLLFAIEENVEFLHRRSQGSTFAAIGSRELSALPIPDLKLPQQRSIANILTTMDEVIEATEKLVEKHQQIKAGLMHDLFTRGLWTLPELARGDHKGLPCEATAQEGQLRPTPEEAPRLYQNSPIGLVPKEWDVNELRNWLSYLSYGFTNPMPESEDGPYMVTAADVIGGGIQYETCRRTTRIAYERLLTEKSRPKIGDVLLTKDGTLGRIAIVERDDVCINQSVAVLRPANLNHSKFLAEMLSSPKWQQKMIADAGGSTIKHIYITVIDKMLVGWPIHSSEADAIFTQIESANQQLELEKLHLAKLRQQKQGLMHDLLTGRVRVDLRVK